MNGCPTSKKIQRLKEEAVTFITFSIHIEMLENISMNKWELIEKENILLKKNAMKVLLKKSTEDMNWGGDDYDIISLNPMSKALTDCYLPLCSPFTVESDVAKRLGTMKQMYLSLKSKMCRQHSHIYFIEM